MKMTEKEMWAEIRIWERLKKSRAKEKAANERERIFQEQARENNQAIAPQAAPRLRDALERAKGGIK